MTAPSIQDDRRLAKETFLAVRELEPSARTAYLDAVCAGKEQVRRRVLALLRADTAIGPSLLAPAPVVDGVAADPDEIDGYQLLEILGEGGFGTVYRARRAGPVEKDVALKLLRAGVQTPESLARFRLEQRALEAMDHPGIARVLDAGVTASGRPYLVMELVKGEPVTSLADRESLTIMQRIQLAIEICRAVQHAHQKGVIHRDLKPSNILAGREPGAASKTTDSPAGGRLWARIIDFGVAKAVADSRPAAPGTAPLTRRLELIGTPAYMSPEQARASKEGDVDTRADVYSLGAVLYELLCGRPVIDQGTIADASPAQIERLVCEDQPPTPSGRAAADPQLPDVAHRRNTEGPRLVRALRGDFDWICMRALEKDRSRRYPTAEALAADLTRALAGEAVDAAPPSTLYRLSRVVRRHRGPVVGAGVAALAMVIGTAVSLHLMFRAREAERVATEQRNVTDAVNTYMRWNLFAAAARSATPGDQGGRDVPMREVLDQATRNIDVDSGPGGRYAGQPAVQSAIRAMLARTFFALGAMPEATSQAESALALARLAGGERSPDTVRALTLVGNCYREGARPKEAEPCFLSAVQTGRRALGDDDPATLEAIHGLANLYYWGLPRLPEAERLFREVHAARERTLGPEHPDTLQSAYGLARTLLEENRLDEAETLHRQVLEARRRVLGDDNPETLWSRFNVARVLVKRGRLEEGEMMHREVLESRRRMLGQEHLATVASMQDLADVLLAEGHLDEAEDVGRRCLEIARRIFTADHPDLLGSMLTLGAVLARKGQYDEAMTLLEPAVAGVERALGPEAPDTKAARSQLESVRTTMRSGR